VCAEKGNSRGNLKLACNGNAIGNGNNDVGIGNESVPKIITNDRIKFFLLNCNQHFGNSKPYQFPSVV